MLESLRKFSGFVRVQEDRRLVAFSLSNGDISQNFEIQFGSAILNGKKTNMVHFCPKFWHLNRTEFVLNPPEGVHSCIFFGGFFKIFEKKIES